MTCPTCGYRDDTLKSISLPQKIDLYKEYSLKIIAGLLATVVSGFIGGFVITRLLLIQKIADVLVDVRLLNYLLPLLALYEGIKVLRAVFKELSRIALFGVTLLIAVLYSLIVYYTSTASLPEVSPFFSQNIVISLSYRSGNWLIWAWLAVLSIVAGILFSDRKSVV